jgi:hypothetical protein
MAGPGHYYVGPEGPTHGRDPFIISGNDDLAGSTPPRLAPDMLQDAAPGEKSQRLARKARRGIARRYHHVKTVAAHQISIIG